MGNILFLTQRVSMGFGVSVAIYEMSIRMQALGHKIVIGCIQHDWNISGIKIWNIQPNARQIMELVEAEKIQVVVAHTTPFFEVLPALPNGTVFRWCLEYGDPTPDFFDKDAEERRLIALNKQINVYPCVDGVLAISKFIAADINWPQAPIIPMGCDHVPDVGEKTYNHFLKTAGRKLRVGSLMRLGVGEQKYKGNQIFVDICERLQAAQLDVDCFVMGRGTPEDELQFAQKGIQVYRNASDEERAEYLRDLDIFISASMWEGFNLPLVEAQKRGTLAMAFDVGAHPEVCPFIFSDVDQMVEMVLFYAVHRERLLQDSQKCNHYVSKRFNWDVSVLHLCEILIAAGHLGCTTGLTLPAPPHRFHTRNKFWLAAMKFRRSLRDNGFRATMKKVWGKLAR